MAYIVLPPEAIAKATTQLLISMWDGEWTDSEGLATAWWELFDWMESGRKARMEQAE